MVFPSESVTEYVISYIPATLTFTSPVTISLFVKSLSSVSVTVTPSYLSNWLSNSIDISSAPNITGLSLLFIKSFSTISLEFVLLVYPLALATTLNEYFPVLLKNSDKS